MTAHSASWPGLPPLLPLSSRASLSGGQVLPRGPRYEVVADLGRGGMANVQLARTVGAAAFERLVVIKRLHPHLARDVSMVRRFVREARIASHLHHTNVVAIQHVGRDEQGYYLVFDYVEGDSLSGLIEREHRQGGRVPTPVVLRILLDALEGLHAAHEAHDGFGRPLGILHRDATPQNVLIGRDGVARLADFGLSRVEMSSTHTAPGTVVGKVLYMAPEYLREQPVDRRIDVYAMGISAWVALTGHRPFEAKSDADLVRMILERPLPSPRSKAPDLDPMLCELVLRACAPDPDDRFPTARAMAEAIERLEAPRHGIASPDQVAEYIELRLGQELSTRRSSVPPPRPEPVLQRRSALSLPPAPRPSPAGVVVPAAPITLRSNEVTVEEPSRFFSAGAVARGALTAARRLSVAASVVALTWLCLGAGEPATVEASPSISPAAAPAAPSPSASDDPDPPEPPPPPWCPPEPQPWCGTAPGPEPLPAPITPRLSRQVIP